MAITRSPSPAPPCRLRVTDTNGQGVGNVSVTFAVTGGGGSITGATAFTDATGVASVGSWTLGTSSTQTLSASVGSLAGSPVIFSATSASQIIVTQQPPATTTSGASFDVTVELRAQNGNLVPVTGHALTISIASGGGTLNAAGTGLTVNTVGGIATFNVSITGGAGSRTLQITSPNLPSVNTTSVTIP